MVNILYSERIGYAIFSFLHGLRFGNPQRGFRHRHGKIIDLHAVKLTYGHLDRIGQIAHGYLRAGKLSQNIIFRAAQGNVTLRQKIAAAAGRIQQQYENDTIKRRSRLCGFKFFRVVAYRLTVS